MSHVKAILVTLMAILAPVKAIMLATGFLIMADMVFGMWAAYKRGEPITSAGMRRTVTKMLVFQTAIITGFICEHYLMDGLFPISKLVAGVIGTTELKSLLENLSAIYGQNIFKSLLEKLGSNNDK